MLTSKLVSKNARGNCNSGFIKWALVIFLRRAYERMLIVRKLVSEYSACDDVSETVRKFTVVDTARVVLSTGCWFRSFWNAGLVAYSDFINWIFWFFVCAAAALQAFHRTLDDPDGHLVNWQGNNPCEEAWRGVVCSAPSGPSNITFVNEL